MRVGTHAVYWQRPLVAYRSAGNQEPTLLKDAPLGYFTAYATAPALLFVASNPAAAAGANIGVSGVAAATASFAHLRARRVNWRLVGWMLAPSIAGAVAGGVGTSASC